jgi:hypothetical protein
MIKKLHLIVLVLCMVLGLASCAAIPQTNFEETSSNQQTTTTPPTTTTVDLAAISAQLAQLTNEDGTGEIHLGMNTSAVSQVLDSYNITYTTDFDGALVYTADNTVYSGHDVLNNISMNQTKNGLQIGDAKSHIIELYGQPNITWDDAYIYYMEKPGDTIPINFSIGFSTGSGAVTRIQIGYADPNGGSWRELT